MMKRSFGFCLLSICWLGLGIASIMGMPANYQVLFAVASLMLTVGCGVRAAELWHSANK